MGLSSPGFAKYFLQKFLMSVSLKKRNEEKTLSYVLKTTFSEGIVFQLL